LRAFEEEDQRIKMVVLMVVLFSFKVLGFCRKLSEKVDMVVDLEKHRLIHIIEGGKRRKETCGACVLFSQINYIIL
jgi:hypothetical protein